MTDLVAMGHDVSGTYIISSDESKNYQCNAELLPSFNECVHEYCNKINGYNYFIVINCGNCVYVAISDKETSQLIGTYPENNLYRKNDDFKYCDLSLYSYEDLYQICLEKVMSE